MTIRVGLAHNNRRAGGDPKTVAVHRTGMHSVDPRGTTTARRREIYRDAMAVLTSDCGHGVTVERVARKVATSRRQLQRAFSEIGGTTFSAALRDVRMDRAALLLRRSSATVAAVADRVGYHEPSQFTKAFRRRHGRTPTALRASPTSPSEPLPFALPERVRKERPA